MTTTQASTARRGKQKMRSPEVVNNAGVQVPLKDILAYARQQGYEIPGRTMVSSAPVPWRVWLARHFPHVSTAAPSARHIRLWDWGTSLVPGVKPRARIEAWPRGGGKSSTAELLCVHLSETLTRRFGLYVCDTQDQADLHVQSIAGFMEQRGMPRAMNRYGRAKAWNRQQLRTQSGFNVAGFGLDAASRGVKIEEYRPDFIILDDVDSQDDSAYMTRRKIDAITTAILPTGSADCAVLFVESLVHEDSVIKQLIDGRADFLLDREITEPEPAVVGLQYIQERDYEGRRLFRITGGIATWEGQPLETCQAQLNEWGERAFLREAQHEVKSDPRFAVFDVDYLRALLPTLEDPIETFECGVNGLSGEFQIWEKPERGVRYVIGADVAEGLKKDKTDESTANILRMDTWEEVGIYFGKPDPRSFGVDLGNIAEWYNRATVVPENNSFGVGTVAMLEEMGANVWSNDPEDDRDTWTEDRDQSSGMRTTRRTKGMVDGELRSAIIDAGAGRRSIVIRSARTCEQCIHYVNLPNNTRGGEGAWKDDLVRSLGLAWYIAKDHGLRPAWEPREQSRNPYTGLYRHRGK